MRRRTRRTASHLLSYTQGRSRGSMKTTVLALIVFLTLPSLAHAEEKQQLPSLPTPFKQDKMLTAVRIGMWTTQAMDLSVTQRDSAPARAGKQTRSWGGR